MRRDVVFVAMAVALAAGCDTGERSTNAQPSASSTTTAGAPVDDPAVDRDRFASANELRATPQGFRPVMMIALIEDPISIVNETPGPLIVRFTNYRTPEGLAESPPIPPGERFSWRADSGHSAVVVADGVPGEANIVIEPDALAEPDGGTGRAGAPGG